MDFAIIQTGGKQYKVSNGDTIRVESIPGDQGDIVTIDDVRMTSLDGNISIGNPNVTGASVKAEVVESVKIRKLSFLNIRQKLVIVEKMATDSNIQISE